MRDVGFKTVSFEEFAARVLEYRHPSDLDLATQQATVDEIAANWGEQRGFLRLNFDDATMVLIQIDHRLESGAYQELWATGEDPATVAHAGQRAEAVAGFPTSFMDMWMTYNRWEDYLEYARGRAMDENTDFLIAVETYRQAPSIPAQLELYGTYVAEGAARQINIDGGTRLAIEERADGGADVFDAAQHEIFTMLSGEFSTGFLPWLTARA